MFFPCRGVIFSQAQQLVSRSYQQFNDLRDTMESCRGVIYHVPIIHVFVLPYEKRKSSCVVAFQACTERTKTSAPTRVCCVWNGINSAPTSILRKDIANERNANLFPCRGVIYHVPISHVFVFPYEKRKSSCWTCEKNTPLRRFAHDFQLFCNGSKSFFLHSITHYYTHDTPILTWFGFHHCVPLQQK